MLLRSLALIPLCLVLFACQSKPVITTPAGITFEGVSYANIEETTAQAQAHCRKSGKDAQFTGNVDVSGRLTFNCV